MPITDIKDKGQEGAAVARYHWWFLISACLSLLLYHQTVRALCALSLHDERYTHLMLMPFIGAALLWFERKKVFQRPSPHPWLGLALVVAGASIVFGLRLWPAALPAEETLSLSVLGIVVTWLGAFICFYGTGVLGRAAFPMGLMLLSIPIPAYIVQYAEIALQKASADVLYSIFQLTGTTVFRQGTVFSLPGLNIEVARECSGIRSTIALLITAMVLGHLFLRSGWRKAAFVLFAIPVSIFKNALRIAALSWLAIGVSPDYLYGNVHHYSGLPVSALALCLMIPAILLLQRTERTSPVPPPAPHVQPAPGSPE